MIYVYYVYIYISFLEPPTLLQARDDLAVRQHADVLLDDFLPASIKRLGVFGFRVAGLPVEDCS